MLHNPLNKKQITLLKSKNIKMFLFFTFLSFAFWLLINLSKESINTAKFEISYNNLPKTKVFQDKPLNTINLEIKTHGFNFLTFQLKKKKLKINLTHLQFLKENIYFYIPNNYLRDFQNQFSQNVEVLSVGVDTLFFNLTTNTVKKVIIKPNLKVNFKMGYNYVKPIKVEPDSVEIEGPKAWLDSINEVSTNEIVLKNLSKNTNQKIDLKKATNSQLKYSISTVNLSVFVDKFTETSLVTNFEIINVPSGYTIFTIPKEVTIKYQVSLTNFSKVTPSSFKVICNYALSSKDSLPYLIPQIIDKPTFVKGVTLTPKRIEYLIKK